MTEVVVNVTIQTTDTTPADLADVRWTVLDATETVVYGSGKTDSDGEFTIDLEDATSYKLQLTEAYTTFTPNPKDLVVVAVTDPQAFTFTGVYDAPEVSGLDLCIVYGTLTDLAGVDYEAAKITAEHLYGVTDLADLDVVGRIVETTSDTNGRFALELLRGATVRVYVHNTKVVFRVVVPDQAKIEITALMALAEAEIQDVVRG